MLERVRAPPDAPTGDVSAAAVPVPCAAAARCAPSFAMTREREMRGLRATSCFGFGGSTVGRGILDGELSAMIIAAAAPSDVPPATDDAGEDIVRFVSGWLKMRVGRGDIGLLAVFRVDAAA